MNPYMGIARAIVPALIAWAIGKGYIPQSIAGDADALAIAVAAAIWSWQTNIEEKHAPPPPPVKAALPPQGKKP